MDKVIGPFGTRFKVVVWHGESGSIFEVRDSISPDSCEGIFSTIAYGGNARAIADRLAADMNSAKNYDAALFACRKAHRTYARRIR